MKTRQLPAQAELKRIVYYDPKTGVFTWLKSWGNARTGRRADILRMSKNRRYRSVSIRGKNHYAHRLAYVYMTGEDPGPVIDHDDRDGENNSWANLKKSTYRDNLLNARHNREEPNVYPIPSGWKVSVRGKYLGVRRYFADAVALRDQHLKETSHA